MKRYYLSSKNGDASSSSNTTRIYLTNGVCEKNQAERIGGHALDGCQSFWPSGEEGTPASLICAACHCQRTFHKIQVHIEHVDVANHNNKNNNNNDSSPPPTQQQGPNSN